MTNGHSSDCSQNTTPDRAFLDRLADSARVTRVEARMPTNSEPLSAAEQKNILMRFRQWIDENNLRQRRVADHLEISPTTFNQVLKGKYGADPSKFLRQFLDLMTDPKSAAELSRPVNAEVVRTSTIIDLDTAVTKARERGTCCMIIGPSGAGKTTYARARVREKSSCILVELDDERYTRSRLLRRMARSLQIAEGGDFRRAGDALLDAVCDRLSGRGRVVFIDNAHVLNVSNLWTLHAIHDRTGATIVAMGQPKLWDTIQNSRTDRGIGATIFARFGIKLDLTDATAEGVDPTNGDRVFKPRRDYLHTLDDVIAFLKSRKLKLHPAAIDWLHKLCNCPTEGGFHAVEDIVGLAADAYSDVPQLTLQHLMAANRIVSPNALQALVRDRIRDLRPATAPAAAVG